LISLYLCYFILIGSLIFNASYECKEQREINLYIETSKSFFGC